MPKITVELPGLILTNEKDRGVAYLRDLKNWHNAPSTERNSEQRESGIGMFRDDSPAEGGRFPIVLGELRSFVVGDEWLLRDTVMLLKSIGPFELRVTDPSGVWRAEVVITGQIEFDLFDDGWCQFEIPLEAADSRRYGPKQVASTGVPTPGVGIDDPILDPFQEGDPGTLGRVVLQNPGSAPSDPVVTVSGGLAGGVEILCIETARIVRVTRPIPEGSMIRVDMGTGEVWIDGQSQVPAQFVPVAEWISVAPRETCTLQFTPLGVVTGTPTMTADWAVASW